MTKLTPQNVEVLVKACLDPEGETVEAIQHRMTLNTEGVEDQIKELLDQLPDNFRKDAGGGWSFLNACMTKDGDQWTGEHRVMEQLVILGLASGLVEWCVPRDMWKVLPGGMPYFMIK